MSEQERLSSILVELSVLSQAAAELNSNQIDALLHESFNQVVISNMKEVFVTSPLIPLSKVEVAQHLLNEIDHLLDVSLLSFPDLVDTLNAAKLEAEHVLQRELIEVESLGSKTKDTI